MTHLFCILAASFSIGQDPAGFWKGAIELPSGSLEILVDLTNSDGAWSGTIDIPLQGIRGFALSECAGGVDWVQFKMAGIPGEPSFEGKLDPTGDALSGNFEQNGMAMSFSLKRAEREKRPVDDYVVTPIPGAGAKGEWMGTLEVGPMKLRLAMTITAEAGSDLAGTLESLDQNASFGADTLTFNENTMAFTIGDINGAFSGTLNDDGSACAGTWTQMGNELPLTFFRVEKAQHLKSP